MNNQYRRLNPTCLVSHRLVILVVIATWGSRDQIWPISREQIWPSSRPGIYSSVAVMLFLKNKFPHKESDKIDLNTGRGQPHSHIYLHNVWVKTTPPLPLPWICLSSPNHSQSCSQANRVHTKLKFLWFNKADLEEPLENLAEKDILLLPFQKNWRQSDSESLSKHNLPINGKRSNQTALPHTQKKLFIQSISSQQRISLGVKPDCRARSLSKTLF